MSKAVLISIRPKWCEKIISGEKTVEVRKTRPKLKTPFRCYIYCTLPPQTELFTHGCIREYANELIRLQSGEIVYGYGMQLCCDEEHRPYTKDNFLCKKVIGEFACDCITPLYNVCTDDWDSLTGGLHKIEKELVSAANLTEAELHAYANGKNCYAWHISDLQIYDMSRELDSFRRECVNDLRCESCAMYWNNNGTCGNDALNLHRPPQSWCYVKEEQL